MIIAPFAATLVRPFTMSDVELPLSNEALARLKVLVPDGEEMFLTIRDDLNVEYVKVINQCDALLVERTAPRTFPRGACVYFENSVEVTKWLICNHDCCAGDCPCEPVTPAGITLPVAKVGVPWQGVIVFQGSTPMTVGLDANKPAWVDAVLGPNYVMLTGTPTNAGTFSVGAAASNCSGSAVSVQSGTITVGPV